MGNATVALIFVVLVNMLMFIHQAAVLSIEPTGTTFYNSEGTILENFNENELDTNMLISKLPTGETSISPTTGNIFTDMFSSIKGWFLDLPGVRYVYSIVSAPYIELKRLGLPGAFVFAVGSAWYAITLFIIVGYFWKGD